MCGLRGAGLRGLEAGRVLAGDVWQSRDAAVDAVIGTVSPFMPAQQGGCGEAAGHQQ